MKTKEIKEILDNDGVLIVSENTLRVEDLLEKFESFIESENLQEDIDSILSSTEELDYNYASDILQDVFEELDNLAPEGYYFGNSEGDGACFGFFPLEEFSEL